MKSYLTFVFAMILALNAFSKARAPKPQNRFSFSAGLGPSYSIWNDKLLVDGEDTIFKGSYYFKRKKASGLNLFGEFSCMFRRNFYLTVGIDYNQFSKKYGYNTRYRSPDYQNEISFDYYGALTDHNTSIQFTINKEIEINRHSIHLGTGIYFMFLREPYILIGFQPPPYQTNFTVSNTAHAEFGFPFQLCYEYAINKKWSIGFKTQYQYLLSTRNSQNIYFSPYFRLNIQKMDKKRKLTVESIK